MIDSSSSIRTDNFRIVRSFVETVVKSFEVGPNKASVFAFKLLMICFDLLIFLTCTVIFSNFKTIFSLHVSLELFVTTKKSIRNSILKITRQNLS